jgi:teichuronic acid exporter
LIRISDKLQLIGSAFVSQGLRILTTLVLARLLSPEDYGAYMLVLALPALIGAMGDFGIPTTLVQLKQGSERQIVDTAFVLGTLLYVAYGLMTLGGGVYLAITHDDPRLVIVAAIAATGSLLGEWYNIQLSILNRRMDFRTESRQNLWLGVSTACTGVLMAFAGFGVYALALQLLIGQLIANIAVLRASPMRWPKHFSMPLARMYFSLGGKVSLALYVSNVQGSITNLIVNHMGGQAALGAWGRATQVQAMFGQNLLSSFERVLYPVLCRSIDDVDRRRDLFVRSLLLLMLPSAFACAWLIAGREAIVRLVLGPQWTLVPPLILVVAFAIPAGVFGTLGYRMAYAMGRTSLMLRAGIIDLVLFFPVLWFVWPYGVAGVAGAWVFSKMFVSILVVAGTWRDINPSTGSISAKMLALFICAAISGWAMAWSASWLEIKYSSVSLLVRFITVSLGGLVLYLGLVMLAQRSLIYSVIDLSRGGAGARSVSTVENLSEATGQSTI